MCVGFDNHCKVVFNRDSIWNGTFIQSDDSRALLLELSYAGLEQFFVTVRSHMFDVLLSIIYMFANSEHSLAPLQHLSIRCQPVGLVGILRMDLSPRCHSDGAFLSSCPSARSSSSSRRSGPQEHLRRHQGGERVRRRIPEGSRPQSTRAEYPGRSPGCEGR